MSDQDTTNLPSPATVEQNAQFDPSQIDPSQVSNAPVGSIGANMLPNVGGASLTPLQGAALAGTGSGLLFNIPEAIIKAVGGSNWLKKKLANPDIAKAYNLGKLGGSILGTVATIPVSPVNVAAKGLEGLGAAKAAATLRNLGTTGNILGGATRGALEGGLFTGAHEIGQNDPEALTHIAQGAAFGGLTGGALSGIGGLLGEGIFGGGNVAEKVRNLNSEEVVGALGAKPGDIRKVAQFGLKPRMTFAKGQEELAVKNLAADIAAGKGPYPTGEVLNTPEKMSAWIENHINSPYNAMEQAYANGGVTLADHLDEIGSLPAVQSLQQKHPELVGTFIDKLDAADKEGSYRGAKSVLDELIHQAQLTKGEGETAANALSGAANQTKQWINDVAGNEAVAQGLLQPQDWQRLNEVYPAKKLFDAILERQSSGVSAFAPNSSTYGRFAVGGLLANQAQGSPDEPIGQRILTDLGGGAIGILGGNALNQGLSRLGNAGLVRLATGVRRMLPEAEGAAAGIAPAFGKQLTQAGPLGARIAAALGTNAVGRPIAQATGAPQGAPAQAMQPEAQPGAVSAATPVANNALENQLNQAIQYQFLRHTQGNPMLSSISPNNPYWVQFAEGAKEMLSSNGQLDPVKAAQYLFPNQAQAKLYQNYEVSVAQINELLAQTQKGALGTTIGGALGPIGGNEPAFLNPAAVQARKSIIETVKDSTGSAAAANQAAFILRRTVNPAEALAQIKQLLVERSAAPALLKDALAKTGGV